MLNIALPEFRLPREIIDMEIKWIENSGVEIEYNSPIDANHTINDLKKEGFDAVFLSAGAQASKRIGLPGEEEGLEGLYYGLNFLRDVRLGHDIRLSGKTVVIGGGNVAMDVARTALRAGSDDVQVFCLESRDEMPAWAKDVHETEEEGALINTQWSPEQISQENGRIKGISFSRCLAVFDQEGNFSPECDESDNQYIDADNIIISIGQAPDTSFISEDTQLERALWGSLAVDENTLATNVPGVFAGGDFTTGPTFVIRAIASGRRAALAIHKYLSKDQTPIFMPDEKTPLAQEAGLALDSETTEDQPRVQVETEKPEERVCDFREVERGFTAEQAHFEATRCLRCDLEKERR